MTQRITTDAGHSQRMRALFPPPPRTTRRGRALDACLHLRGLRSWVTPGSYAWWRLCDDIKTSQQALLAVRRTANAQ